jgi:hypothetical protein
MDNMGVRFFDKRSVVPCMNYNSRFKTSIETAHPTMFPKG